MSRTTPINLRHLMIYQVYVRNHTPEGTFVALIDDLDRIKALGSDVVYLLPIHPIGKKNRKGELGSPYSISDYYGVNTELGTLDDFKALIKETHKRGMKIMMDIVFNHTSYDSVLIDEHPEYFYTENGEFKNRVGDWWDITDFDYSKDKGLWQYLTDNLVYWSKMGVDGFRFDVTSLLPLEFLEQAHEAVKAVDEDTIWLSESVHGGFLREIRNRGFEGLSESEVYQVFDMAYDYDAHVAFEHFLKGEGSLKDYVDWIMRQEEIYPKNYVKMRNLENHDFGRIAGMLDNNHDLLLNWHAFSFFLKGATMIFGGGEYSNAHHPDLFNKDTISREGKDISPFINRLSTLVKDSIFSTGTFALEQAEGKDVLVGSYQSSTKQVVGVFNVGKEEGSIMVPCANGRYKNLLNGSIVEVKNRYLTLEQGPIIFEVKE